MSMSAVLFAALCLCVGGIIGLRYKVLALVPALIAVCAVVLVGGPVVGVVGSPILTFLIIAVVFTQLGYALGAVARSFQLAGMFRRRADRVSAVVNQPARSR